jgi:signal transduction histidine kinase
MKAKHAPVRLTELVVVVVIVVGALIAAERAAWLKISRLRTSMTVEQLRMFRSADRVRAVVLELRGEWQRGIDAENSANSAGSHAAVAAAQRVIAEQNLAAANSDERELIEQIHAAFNNYASLITNAASSAGVSNAAQNTNINRAFEHVLTLTDQLAALNQSAAERFVADADASLTRLQQFLLASLVALLAAGTVIVLLAYRRTITPLRNTLTESRAIIERQEKLASLGVFAAGIAHEIRNPLTAIKVRLFSLKASHAPGTSERDDSEVIEGEIERLERIVRDFLQFARPSDPVLETMRSGKLLQDTSALLESELAKRSIRLKFDVEADHSVSVDADKMKQVLINFIQNAADSMESGGVVTLRSRLDRQPLNGRVVPVLVLDIADTGKGMPSEVQKRLFDPFFTTKEKGTGLGLPISARIVEKHGGVIQYKTQPGRGTTFSIVLPLAQTDEDKS